MIYSMYIQYRLYCTTPAEVTSLPDSVIAPLSKSYNKKCWRATSSPWTPLSSRDYVSIFKFLKLGTVKLKMGNAIV
jgi:hypothetical protein